MDVGVLISSGIGTITTCISGFISWFIARRKYNIEVDSTEIHNMKESLEFYEDIVHDNTRKLQHYVEELQETRVEVYSLQSMVQNLLKAACIDNTCLVRKRYTREEMQDILASNKDLSTTEDT